MQTLHYLARNSAIASYYEAKVAWFFADLNEKIPLNAFPCPENIDHKKSNIQLKAFLKTLEEKEDGEIIEIVLRVICANYQELDQFDESLPYMDQSVKRYLRANLPMPAYYVLAYELRALFQKGKLKEASAVEKHLTKFLATHQTTRETSLITWHMSDIYVLQNRPTQFFALLTKTDTFLEQVHEEQLRPNILGRIGSVYITLGLPGKALGYESNRYVLSGKRCLENFMPQPQNWSDPGRIEKGDVILLSQFLGFTGLSLK